MKYTDDQIATGEWVRSLAEQSDRGIKAFYHTKAWAHKRKAIMERDHFACQYCKAKGKYTKAVTVHHEKHLKEVPELALTDENLVSLCSLCHEEAHPERHHPNGKEYSQGFQTPERW